MDIKITDMDVVDVNTEVAKQFLMKSRCVTNSEQKLKSLIFAKQSLDNAIKSFGLDINNIKFKKIDSSKDVTLQTSTNNKQ